jgi:murein DD-endopeptidase MepM/ murein hydrolase activator NlpD
VLTSILAPSLQAQDPSCLVALTTSPATLTEGTLAWLGVRVLHGGKLVSGEAAGEPLHFERRSAGGVRALIAIPVDGGDTVPISMVLHRGDGTDTLALSLPVRGAEFPSELLSVAPAYATPDSAATARIQAEIAQSRALSRRSQTRPRIWTGEFRVPRKARITSRFGTARVYNGEVQSRHLGTDFAGATGAPVYAAGRGVVALVADFYLAGHVVYIDHGAGLMTGYFHLSRIDVRKGQRVVAGQRIGAVGRSGRVTGPHLHWVARYGAISVDPMSLLTLKEPGGK